MGGSQSVECGACTSQDCAIFSASGYCKDDAATSSTACNTGAEACGENTYFDGTQCLPDGDSLCPGSFNRQTGQCEGI